MSFYIHSAVPCLFFLFMTALATNTSMLFDPGPSYYCWDYSYTAPPVKPVNQTDDYRDCSHFNGTGHAYPGHTWGSDQNGWSASDQKQYPGYDIEASGPSGEPLTVTLTNNARTSGGCGETVWEIAFTYLYSGYSFVKQPNGSLYNLRDYDQIVIEYDVEVVSATNASASHSCPYQRNYVTTDFIYMFNTTCDGSTPPCETDWKRVFSIKHFDPLDNVPDSPSDAKFKNACSKNVDFCSLMINGQQRLSLGTKAHISLDFKSLINTWSSVLNHTGTGAAVFPATANVYAIQIVSSNVENDSVIRVGNVTAVMRNT